MSAASGAFLTGSNRLAPGGETELAAVRAMVNAGRHEQAHQSLIQLEPGLQHDLSSLQQSGEIHLALGRFDDAVRCYRRAVALAPDHPGALYNLASALITTGDLSHAETLLDRVVVLDPRDGDAFYNRATLRRWTAQDNHIPALIEAVNRARHPGAETAFCYALAKEFEDLSDHAAAWSWIERGAARRRAGLSYQVKNDVETMALLVTVFSAQRMAQAPKPLSGPGPIFVLGLPRSGTTLVDRILCAHSQVDSLGEISDLALGIVRGAGPAKSKADLVRRSTQMDPALLPALYGEAVQTYGRTAPWLIDKTPANYLYIGLIALFLPQARIVHVRRGPMDNGFALLKTLFRTGCPYSYSLDDLAAYMGAQHRLMAHWRQVLPGRLIEIDYEALVDDQEGQSRQLLSAIGLDWEPACLDFHSNPAPTATASAAQVRRPIYRDSVALWRHHEIALAPLKAGLQQQGVL
jgi:tetratricopeptide (TPR) repeat protein